MLQVGQQTQLLQNTNREVMRLVHNQHNTLPLALAPDQRTLDLPQ